MDTTTLNPDKVDAFVGQFVTDFGAALFAPLVVLGDRLGLYKALAAGGRQTAADISTRTGIRERSVAEWLRANAAAGYVTYDAPTDSYALSPEQEFTLADESSPAFLPGAFQIALSVGRDIDRITDALRSGRGYGWDEHDALLFEGTERFFRPGYAANLVDSWLPSLDGVVDKLVAGARVADVGCGHGASTILMAQAYPASRFVGFDFHAASIDAARKRAAEAGVADRVTFQVAGADDFPGKDYDLVTLFDCFHDMGRPIDAARHIARALSPGGTLLLVEPQAGHDVADNLNPVGRVFYSASTTICTLNAIRYGAADSPVLGAQASDADLERALAAGGLTSVRLATSTPFNRVFEVRP
ncbi:MAG: hypothetical protein QOG52_105 [Frankiaceae bacterium]|nr:hypothetical protein [Frankiaceae bacterium]